LEIRIRIQPTKVKKKKDLKKKFVRSLDFLLFVLKFFSFELYELGQGNYWYHEKLIYSYFFCDEKP